MKPRALVHIAIFPLLAWPQQQPSSAAPGNQIALSAQQRISDGLYIRLRGNVQITAGQLVISVEEADYNPMTGELIPVVTFIFSLRT